MSTVLTSTNAVSQNSPGDAEKNGKSSFIPPTPGKRNQGLRDSECK